MCLTVQVARTHLALLKPKLLPCKLPCLLEVVPQATRLWCQLGLEQSA
jgi:hypothetical protein